MRGSNTIARESIWLRGINMCGRKTAIARKQYDSGEIICFCGFLGRRRAATSIELPYTLDIGTLQLVLRFRNRPLCILFQFLLAFPSDISAPRTLGWLFRSALFRPRCILLSIESSPAQSLGLLAPQSSSGRLCDASFLELPYDLVIGTQS